MHRHGCAYAHAYIYTCMSFLYLVFLVLSVFRNVSISLLLTTGPCNHSISLRPAHIAVIFCWVLDGHQSRYLVTFELLFEEYECWFQLSNPALSTDKAELVPNL